MVGRYSRGLTKKGLGLEAMSEPEKIGQPITKSIIGKIILDPVDRQPGKLSHLKTV